MKKHIGKAFPPSVAKLIFEQIPKELRKHDGNQINEFDLR